MKARFRTTRGKVAALVGLLAIAAPVAIGVSAIAGEGSTKSEHWGLITRNTIGSAVADLRDGPYGSFGVNGPAGSPPFGKGSVGIQVSDEAVSGSDKREKATFGNEVDFFGDPLQGLNQVGFHIFQTGENGAGNLPNITLEVDPSGISTNTPGLNYSSLVFVPNGTGVTPNQWSGPIDATDASNGYWYFTNAATATATNCGQANNCSFTQMKTNSNTAFPNMSILTVAVAKGRDNKWVGAVDGLRINEKLYDFESDGVKDKHAK